MTITPDIRNYDIDEIRADAEDIYNSPAFAEAMRKLRTRYYGQLAQCSVGDLTSITVHASIRVLEDVVQELQVLVTDAKVKRRSR